MGGSYDRIGGTLRRHIAAVDVVSGVTTNWAPEADRAVRALLVHGGLVYVGGDFSWIGGELRSRAAAIHPISGLATAWDPDVQVGACYVSALAAVEDTIYLGGLFSSVGTAPRLHLAAVDATTALATPWNPTPTGPDDSVYGAPYISSLVVRGHSIYVGGHFTGIGGQVRGGLAQVDLATGLATSWNPDPGPWMGSWGRDVTALSLSDSTLMVAGRFESMGGFPRRLAAEVDLVTGLPTPWNPAPNQGSLAIAVAGSAVYLGGNFTGLGPQWLVRHNLAAFDATTGTLLDWDPNPDGYIVTALAVARGEIYVGGYFSTIGGQVRFGMASLDTLTGLATGWNPTANSVVGSILVVGDTMYVGGYFTTMGGQPRGRLASFDLTTGALTDWNPSAASDVYCLAAHERTIWVGGFFRSIGGVTRNRLAAVDRVTGAVTAWHPNADSWVNALALVGDTLFVGGRFRAMGGLPRNGLAAVRVTTGQTVDWVMDANSVVTALAVIDDTLLIGGSFSTLSGRARSYLAAADISTGDLLPWSPRLNGGVLCLTASQQLLYVGGAFHVAGTSPASALTAISFAPQAPGPDLHPTRTAIAWIAPNPVRTTSVVRFALPTASKVDLAVFDVQGRRVATLLRRADLAAGTHDVPFRPDGWRDGFYVLHFEASGVTSTRKFVVLK